ncbi:MAG: translocation/assembly module TamB domain-containing protein, partial [Pseudomonadota bacterium]
SGTLVADQVSLVASGTDESHTLNATVALPSLTVATALAGGFDAAASTWTGELRELELGVAAVQPWTLAEPVALTLSPERQSVQGLCLAAPDGGEACLDIDSEPRTRDLAVRGRLRALPLGALAGRRVPDVVVDGSLDAEVDLTWRDGSVDGIAGLNVGEASFALLTPEGTADEPIPFSVSGSATVRAGRLNAEADLQVADSGSGRLELTVDDVLDRVSPIDSTLRFDLDDIAFVSVFLPGVDVDAGTFDAEVNLGGTLAAPVPSGSAMIRDAALLVDAAGTRVREFDISIEPAGDQRLAYRGTARVGDGTLSLDGSTRIDAGERWATTVAIDGENAELVRLPDWSVTASPDLTVAYADGRVDISGAIVVPAATVTLDDLPDQAVTASGDAVVHGDEEADAGGLSYRLDLTVSAGDSVRLSGFGLETGLTGELRLSGGDEQGLRGVGALRLVDGRFEAYGQSLAIERGRLNFTGSLTNPLLDFRAVREVGDVRVGIQMAGSVESPRSSLFSQPPLTEADALSYLLTGRPLSAAGSGDGSLLNGAALALGLSQAGKVAAQISASLGLDELGIEGSGEDGRLLAGKWLGESLYLQYAYGIFDKLGSLLVRLSLSERLTLETRSGRQQSLDLVYSVGRD